MGELRLGVNIDHTATLRQGGITARLRADRRHIQDRDIERLRESIVTKNES